MHLATGPFVGRLVTLTLLTEESVGPLARVAANDQIWTFLDEETPTTREAVQALVSEAVQEHRSGARIPYVISIRQTGAVIGSISYLDIQPQHRGVEIGWAWVTPAYWGTGVAREAAYLLIQHAFDEAGAIRVAFKADSRNARSQRAIEGLGAVREGVFRNHRILRDGHVRHSVFYSLTSEDWPDVRRRFGWSLSLGHQ